MMIKNSVTVFLIWLMLPSLSAAQTEFVINDSLQVVKITEHVWQHISGQYYPKFGRFTSNGLIYISGTEAVIMDTPPTDDQARALLDWFSSQNPGITITAVIINHFHDDALGGLRYFHQVGIHSIAHELTVKLISSRADTVEVPLQTFTGEMKLKVGDSFVVNYYPGPAHTQDNIVTWIPDKRILFGGCMVKSEGAGKGNVADADEQAWPATAGRVLKRFPSVRVVVPGHGKPGGKELLTYTRDLFTPK